jgi:hypothetical protein
MDKKILKYKVKKNKLENDINNILNIKKTNYENEVVNSNNNKQIVEEIEKYFSLIKSSEHKSKLLIIIGGIYSVGKTTFINHLQNYIIKLSENTILIKKISYENNHNNTDIFSNIETTDNIIIMEMGSNYFDKNITDIIDTVKNKINNSNQNNIINININIIPKSKKSLKNKYINKIIYDIKNNSNNFVSELNLNNKQTNTQIQNHIDELKIKNNIYSDNDFVFLDKFVDVIFSSNMNFNSDSNLASDIIKFYL